MSEHKSHSFSGNCLAFEKYRFLHGAAEMKVFFHRIRKALAGRNSWELICWRLLESCKNLKLEFLSKAARTTSNSIVCEELDIGMLEHASSGMASVFIE